MGKMIVKKAEEEYKLKEKLQHEATERKRREEFAKKKADMKAMLEAEEAAEEEEMKMLVKNAEEKRKLKEKLQLEATERKRREEFAKKKADMKAILEAEEDEIRLLEERAKEKLELKARLQQEDKEEEEEAARRKQEEEEAKSKRYVSPCLLAARERNPTLGSSDKKETEGDKTTQAKHTRPKPEQHAAADESKQHELSEQDTNNDVDTTANSNNNKLRWMSLQSKIEECRTRLMDPESSMEEQGVAAQLMTKYALSAKVLNKSIIS